MVWTGDETARRGGRAGETAAEPGNLMLLKRIFPGLRRDNEAAQTLYAGMVTQAREPAFYGAVPDTVDGRFELMVLHACLLFHRMKGGDETVRALSQAVFDEMFLEFDRAMRESGVGDLTVPKRIKTMARIFYTRSAAFDPLLDRLDEAGLAAALAAPFPQLTRDGRAQLARYMAEAVASLRATPAAELMAGRAGWPAAPELPAAEAP